MSGRSVVIAGWVTIALGLALMAVHYFGGSDGDPEGWYSAVGFAAPVVGAGALALVGVRFARPWLCVAGGVALAVMCVVSIVMIPLIVPAGFMIGSIRRTSTEAASLVAPALFAGALVAAFGLLVFHQDPVTWSTPEGGGGSSDIVTSAEASISVIVVAVVLLSSILWSHRATRDCRPPR